MPLQLNTKETIRAAGIKSTINRVAVLEYISTVNRPLSHSDIVMALENKSGDQATIYRNLHKFVSVGILRIASQASGITHYELHTKEKTGQQHSHFVCQECGTVSCLPAIKISKTMDDKWKEVIKTAEVQFVGKCPECI
jgi:Fur family transcriptional regulator, ferric uptake regulator